MINENMTLEIEQCLIGCLFRNNASILGIVEEGLTAEDFLCWEHWLMLEHAKAVFLERGAVGVTDMGSIIGNFPKNLDGPLYARDCADAVPCPSKEQARHYAATIKENARKRRIAATLKEVEAILPTRSSEDILAFLGSSMAENADVTRRIKNGSEVFEEILSEFDLPTQCWPTGLHSLDFCMVGGVHAGYTYGFAGKEKSGKTTLAHTISFNLDRAGCPHLYIALEMGSREIERRNIARRLGENSLRFRNLDKAFKAGVKNAVRSENVFYLDAPGSILSEILYEIGIARLRHGIRGFILDYWQLVEGRERGETEEQHLRRTSQSLADYAKKHGLFCIILAQENKDGDLFGGGGLRKACDQLYFIEMPKGHGSEHLRWLRMAASRYTPRSDAGTEGDPAFMLNQNSGPYFENVKKAV